MASSAEVRIAADVRCELGEGPIWHPERQSLIWFDIYAQVLFEGDGKGGPIRALGFGEPVSAAALLDSAHVVVAGASGLYKVNLETAERSLLAPLEADSPATRTNDCRVGRAGFSGSGRWAIHCPRARDRSIDITRDTSSGSSPD